MVGHSILAGCVVSQRAFVGPSFVCSDPSVPPSRVIHRRRHSPAETLDQCCPVAVPMPRHVRELDVKVSGHALQRNDAHDPQQAMGSAPARLEKLLAAYVHATVSRPRAGWIDERQARKEFARSYLC